MDKVQIAKNLKFLRKGTGKKQVDFAPVIFTSTYSLRNFERGNVPLYMLIRYSKHFNKSLDDLCFTDLTMKPQQIKL